MQTQHRRGLWVALALAAGSAVVVVACGSRTGLLGGPFSEDGGEDANPDGTMDGAGDARHDGGDSGDDAADARSDRILPACIPRSCQQSGYQCGTNGDGCGDAIQCGPCPEPQICGVGGYSICGGGFGLGPDGGVLCTPRTCQDLGFNCGPAGDGCNGTLQCGICQYPDTCGGNGKPSHCGNSLPCTNLCLQQVVCDGGATTSITGTVIAGTLPMYGTPDPVYNALVYIPNAPVSAFTPGVQCSQCGADVTGQPLLATQTAPDGTFTLTNVPVGNNIPLVIQLGRWRRQITIPSVAACTSTQLSPTLTRMPRNKSEGDIPQMAIATGMADEIECLLLKMGIDQAEFTQPSGTGRVHLYQSNGVDDGAGTPPATQLWDNPSTLSKYDVVMLPCEGMQLDKTTTEQQNLIAYTGGGGRVFATHYSYTWLYNDPPFSTTSQFQVMQNPFPMVTGTIDTSFQKGQDYATWLQTVGALSGPNQIAITDGRHDVNAVNAPSQQFIYVPNQSAVLQYGFYTPVNVPPSQQCGRVIYNDFHVSGGISTGLTFPNECNAAGLTSQEKALEFMLFDLASCIPAAPQNCTPQTCQQQNIQCGPAGDGCGNEIQCGSCVSPQACGGGGYGKCGYPDAGTCTPKTCQQLGFQCGANGDGCGNEIQCGSCVSPKVCGGGGIPSVCGP
jgi:hypothetical protein